MAAYSTYYLTVKDAADKIRSNPTQKVTPEREGFMAPKVPEVEDKTPSTVDGMVLAYMQGVRKTSTKGSQREKLPEGYRGGDAFDELTRAREALGQIESGGNYGAMGPVVAKGAYKGQRAIGKYQVMEGNIGPWTKEVLGKEMTKEEFLQNPWAQDAVAEYKLANSKAKHGTWDDAASVWFSGRPLAKAGNASDGYNTVPQYVSKFRKAYG